MYSLRFGHRTSSLELDFLFFPDNLSKAFIFFSNSTKFIFHHLTFNLTTPHKSIGLKQDCF